MRHLYILRHGETEWNVAGRMQGRMDSALTDRGKTQAATNGELVKTLGGVDQLWVSPSGRTIETAFIVNSHLRAHLQYADELMERDCGLWSGLLVDEIAERFPDEWNARERDPYWFQPPEGENLQDMLERVHEFLDGLFAEECHAVGLVTHGVMSKVILKFFLGLNEVECARLRHPNHLLYRLTFHAQDIETHHFVDGGQAQAGLLHSETQPQSHPGRERSD
jgi:probable phosphoglycerate mutase